MVIIDTNAEFNDITPTIINIIKNNIITLFIQFKNIIFISATSLAREDVIALIERYIKIKNNIAIDIKNTTLYHDAIAFTNPDNFVFSAKLPFINISIFVIGTLFINILSGVSNHPDFASPAPASLLESCNNIVRSAIILITSITTGK